MGASREAPTQVATAANRFSKSYEDFVDSGLEFAGMHYFVSPGVDNISSISRKLQTISVIAPCFEFFII